MWHDWNEKAQEESDYKTQDSQKEKENKKAQEITESKGNECVPKPL